MLGTPVHPRSCAARSRSQARGTVVALVHHSVFGVDRSQCVATAAVTPVAEELPDFERKLRDHLMQLHAQRSQLLLDILELAGEPSAFLLRRAPPVGAGEAVRALVLETGQVTDAFHESTE